jgi:phosphoglycerol transferase MdoB-like AlkP superfamily enzyme
LIIPHFPYVLSSECDYLGNDEGSSPKQQTLCAIKLMRDLIHKLKSLGRFKDSLIIFQGDHGARFMIKDNELVDVRLLNKKLDAYSPEYSHARSRSLLLIKPAGIGADTNLIVSNKPAELTDIAATLLTSVNLRKPLGMKGVNLFDEQISIQDRTRNYYFYDKLRRIGWTDKMMHYQIHRDVITKMGTITLENNKRTTLLDLVETKTKN